LVVAGDEPVFVSIGDAVPLQISVELQDGTIVNTKMGVNQQAVNATIDGVAFTFVSRNTAVATVALNTNTEVVEVTGVTRGVTVIDVTATSGGQTLEVEVPVNVDAYLSFLYLANPTPNGGGGWITTLGIQPDGGLAVLQGQIDNTGRPLGIFAHPSGEFVYAVNVSGDDITPYRVTQGTGLLTRIGTENFDAGDSPRGMAFAYDGAYAYVNNFNGDVLGYNVQDDGLLVPFGVAATSGSDFSGPAVNPAGDHLYTMNSGDDEVGIYSIDDGDGSLTLITTVPAGDRPFEIAFAANLPFAYVTNANSDDISGYQVVGGNLVPLTPTPVFATGGQPFSIAAHPTLPVVYSVGSDDTSLNVFSINETTGALTLIESVDSGVQPGGPIIDPSGSYMWIARGDYELSTFTIAADGTLTRGPDFADSSIDNGFARTGVTIGNTLLRASDQLLPEHRRYPLD
jgi:YVTN family beta-propeller protein